MLRNIIAVAVVSMALAASWHAFDRRDGASRAPSETSAVIIARTDLPAGTVLTEDMLETLTLPRRYMQQGSFEVRSMTDIKIPVGLAVAVRIPKGDQVTKNCLVVPAAKPAAGPAADKKTLSQEYYVEGLRYFQNSDYQKAREEWKTALKHNPANPDAIAGLKRIEMILAPAKN